MSVSFSPSLPSLSPSPPSLPSLSPFPLFHLQSAGTTTLAASRVPVSIPCPFVTAPLCRTGGGYREGQPPRPLQTSTHKAPLNARCVLIRVSELFFSEAPIPNQGHSLLLSYAVCILFHSRGALLTKPSHHGRCSPHQSVLSFTPRRPLRTKAPSSVPETPFSATGTPSFCHRHHPLH